MILTSEKNGHVLTFDDQRHRYTLDTRSVPGATTFGKGGYPTSDALVGWKIKHAMYAAIEATWVKQNTGDYDKLTDKLKDEIREEAKKRPDDMATQAADIGTVVHDYANLCEAGRIAEAEALMDTHKEHPDLEAIKRAISKFLEWNSRNRDEIIAAEEIVALPCPLHFTQDDKQEESLLDARPTRHYQLTNLCTCYAGKFDALRRRGGRTILSDFKTSTGIYVEMFIQLGAYKPAIEYWLEEPIHGLEILRFGKEKGKEFETLLVTSEDEMKAFQRQALMCRETYAFKRKWDVDDRFKFLGPKVKKTTLKKKGKKNETTSDVQCDTGGGEKTTGKVAGVHADTTDGSGVGTVGEAVS